MNGSPGTPGTGPASAPAPEPATAPAPLAELPRTGGSGGEGSRLLVLASGVGLTLGGLGIAVAPAGHLAGAAVGWAAGIQRGRPWGPSVGVVGRGRQ